MGATSEPLYWHCATCGGHEPAQPEYEHGDHEPCITCEDGTAWVVTLKEGARMEQRHAMGLPAEKNPCAVKHS